MSVVEQTFQDVARQRLKQAIGLGDGELPFPWQEDLLARMLEGGIPEVVDIPTGLGKTSVMAIWLVARACGAKLPRRLVYVVDRRAVVDQATDVALGLREFVDGDLGIKRALGLSDNHSLPISTLRGQHVDNRAWLDDPSSLAIIVGTVDMVGSRLLFSGYGVSSKMRPYHAGLLGADTLVVLDEAHLVPAFEDLLRQVERGADSFGPKAPSLRALVPPFKLLSLSATGRQTDATLLALTDADRRHPIVSRRLAAKKTLRIVELANVAEPPADMEDDTTVNADADEATKKGKGPTLAGVLAKQAWELTTQGLAQIRCLVFCNARKDATAVATELRNLAKSTSSTGPTIELFVGGRRVKERIQAREALARLGFLAGTSVTLERSAFLIATSAGEVGVDLDADHMVCDLVAWERMVQRLGRVNRRGDGDAKVVVVVEAGSPDEVALRMASQSLGDKFPKEQKRTLDLFDKRKKATAAYAKLKQANLAASERKALKKQVGAFKDNDAKKLAEYEAEVAKHHALRKLLDAVVKDGGSLSPDALLTLRNRQGLADAIRDATTVEPLRPELTRPLVDAWSMTSLDEHPGRPEVDPWLRGFRPNDPPQTTVVWRRYLPVRADGSLDAKAAKRFFEAAPPHRSEQLETETHIVLEWLIERAAAISKATGEEALLDAQKVVAIALGGRGEPKGWRTLSQIAAMKSKGKNENKEAKKAREQDVKELEKLIIGGTLVIDSRLGGLTDGLLDDKTMTDAEAVDASSDWLSRPDAPGVPVTGFRIRVLGANEEDESAWRTTLGAGWVRRHLFVTSWVDGEPSAALVIDGWAGDAATEEERAEADRPQALDEHQSWTEDCARQIAHRLGIERDPHAELLALAARLHDEGKRVAQWQNAFRAPANGRPYAKTTGPINFDLLDDYRHEFGSLPYVEADEGFKSLHPDDQDFVLHLVAAHHGYARPVIGIKGRDLPPPSITEEWARKVALRFARLSMRWGPWGLAWWEALLRSADQTASRRNQQPATTQEEQP
ncbi:MAG: CRISPR-associated helicase Cas3 [Nitrospira sp.]|jgi:CRISPR-associated endonuclease/helicase Cas3|nr:MAG: CRISPR-associated helicase Cas3 [Nitrospira sp.]